MLTKEKLTTCYNQNLLRWRFWLWGTLVQLQECAECWFKPCSDTHQSLPRSKSLLTWTEPPEYTSLFCLSGSLSFFFFFNFIFKLYITVLVLPNIKMNPPQLYITFLPRSKRLLISWLQSPSAVILLIQKWQCMSGEGNGSNIYVHGASSTLS